MNKIFVEIFLLSEIYILSALFRKHPKYAVCECKKGLEINVFSKPFFCVLVPMGVIFPSG